MSYLLLAAGIFVLALTLAYLTWKKIRLAHLCADLLRIRKEFQKKVKDIGCLRDEEYLSVARSFDLTISHPECISLSWLAAVYFGDPQFDVNVPVTQNPDLRKVIDEAKEARAWRQVGYVLYETGAGLILRLFIAVIPRVFQPRAQRRATRTVKHYCEKMDNVSLRECLPA